MIGIPKKRAIAFLCIMLLAFLLSHSAKPEGSSSIAIKNVTLIDGTNSAPKPNTAVLVTGDRITSINPDQIPADAKVVDAGGKFLIPGLWDMHVHLTSHKDVGCRVLLASGVTGVRDLGGDLNLIDWLRYRIDLFAIRAECFIGSSCKRRTVKLTQDENQNHPCS